MNVAYLKVTHGLHFHICLFFLGAESLMSFHGHSYPQSFCFQSQTRCKRSWVREWRVRFFFFLKLEWRCPPGSWCPTQTAYSVYRERRYCDCRRRHNKCCINHCVSPGRQQCIMNDWCRALLLHVLMHAQGSFSWNNSFDDPGAGGSRG